MFNIGLNSKAENIEDQWKFPDVFPDSSDLKELAGRVVEIGIRTIFQNATYKFAGKTYHQKSGGPIGYRITMACARVVMQHWGGWYHYSLELSKIEITLLGGYVDDVRQWGSQIRYGFRFQEMDFEL